MEEQEHSLLTQREREMLVLVAQGLGNQEIAERLDIAISTVKSGLHRICTKLKVPTRAQAVLIALREKHLPLGDIYTLEELADFIGLGGPKAMGRMVEILKHKLESN
jgi:DNA-binding CsgD family transcriptional regulator